eukprot:jgi/Tetstr1/425390/TSEL_015837.t1
MLSFILRRLLIALPTLVLVSIFVFTLQKLLPGDPALVLAGEERDPETLAFIREKYHLNEPILYQYFYWVGGLLQGDLGISLRTNQPVLTLIADKLPVTIQLAVMAMIIAMVIGIPAGILSAVKKGGPVDYIANFLALSGLSIPNFWLGIMLILLVSVNLGWLPASGYESIFVDPVRSLETMIMPAFVLGTALAATLMRHTRSAMLGVLKADYVRTARAKGLSERVVVIKHAFRNALLPVVTLGALLFGELLAGAVLTEQIFTIPGFGKLIVDAVFTRDYAVVQGVVLCTAAGFILMNLIADSRVWSKLKRNRGALVGAAPSALYWLGTDEIGRDIFSRMIWGAQASLLAGVVSVLIAVAIGVPFGLVSGYFGGWIDQAISRVLSVKTEDYVEGARAIGLSDLAIMSRYILPNVFAPILVQATLTIATAIIAEASLSFLGLGQQPPYPSWGSMLNVAKNFMTQAPWMAWWPGAAIFLVVLGFNLLGDGLRDALDPRES